MARLAATVMSKALRLIYAGEFGGKKNRKYRMSRFNYRVMSDGRLTRSYIEEIESDLADHGFDQFDREEYFVIQRTSVFKSLRRPPASLRKAAVDAAVKGLKAIPTDADADTTDDDDIDDADPDDSDDA